jgi:hypothetical protein
MINDKRTIRPTIATIEVLDETSDEEKFQNLTLRPILKMQHELLVAFFNHYVASKKIAFAELTSLKKTETIERIFKTDHLFKTELKGLIIGQFTVEEFDAYATQAAAQNKRMITMTKQRLLSTI